MQAVALAPEVNKFCFASESCIPIAPLDVVLQRLYSTAGHIQTPLAGRGGIDINSSWIDYQSSPNNGYATGKQVADLNDLQNCILCLFIVRCACLSLVWASSGSISGWHSIQSFSVVDVVAHTRYCSNFSIAKNYRRQSPDGQQRPCRSTCRRRTFFCI